MVGPENAKKYQTLVFMAGSASAEFFADIGLCPWEAVKVLLLAFHMQSWFAHVLVLCCCTEDSQCGDVLAPACCR